MSTKSSRQAPAQKQKQKQTQNQNKNQQIAQQARQQAQAPKGPQLNVADQQARRESRINRQAEARAASERRRRMRTLRRNAIIAAAVLVFVGFIAVLYIREANKPGQSVPVMAARQHLPADTVSPIEYSTDPPTSGPHTENQVPSWQVYTQPITKELTVHGLEDAGVIINYKPDLDQASVDKLASIATSYIQRGGGSGHVVMAPYTGLSNPIVLTAWGRMDRLDILDEARIRRFVDEYVGIDHHEGSEGKRIP